MNETLKTLKERRSCRKYQTRQVEQEALDLILEAGTYAPTGMNRQAPVIVAVQDKATRDKIAKMNAEVMGADTDPFYGAPTVLVVLANPAVRTYVHDGALVMGNLMNAAHSVGVDSCYIFRAKEVFATEEGAAEVAERAKGHLEEFKEQYLSSIAGNIRITHVSMPWKRMFEVRLDAEFVSQ